MPTKSNTPTKKVSSSKNLLSTSSRAALELPTSVEQSARKAPAARTEWDAEKADAAAKEFASKLTAKMSAKELFVLWGAYYRTSGHKRLAQTAMAYFK